MSEGSQVSRHSHKNTPARHSYGMGGRTLQTCPRPCPAAALLQQQSSSSSKCPSQDLSLPRVAQQIRSGAVQTNSSV